MDLNDTILSEISQTEEDKCHMILLILGSKKKKKPDLIHMENRLVVARLGRVVSEMREGVKGRNCQL